MVATSYSTDRPLTVQEAYERLDAYGRRYGRLPLLLLLHAAVPEGFRADLLNLLKVNFLGHEAAMDMTIDADVLLSPLVEQAAAGYYRIDAEVRRHCLQLLDAAYRHHPERQSVRVARFLLAYADAMECRTAAGGDPLLAEYLAIQRWVALAFVDPGRAAEGFARALKNATEPDATAARLRLGSLTAAISIPLAGHQELLAYARGMDAVVRGDEQDEARRLLQSLGEFTVGGVILDPGRVLESIAPDWTIPQGFERYSEAEHRTWTTLYERQAAILPGRACDAFLQGLHALDLHGEDIPDFERVNEKLLKLTGWRIVAVPGLVPDDVFFEHLANRRFPAANFIRGANELDYLNEPDIFHDVFGHVPMLTDPVFADYMQAYGKSGRRALSLGHLANLARLYWYTVEFGLLETPQGLRIYGAGIVSSRTESIFALEFGFAKSPRLRSRTGDAHALPHRRFPAGLFRHSLVAVFARRHDQDRFRSPL